MRARKLTGPWIGFSFKGGRLVTPRDASYCRNLAWLSLTAAQAHEWRRMMEARRLGSKPRKKLQFEAANVIDLATVIGRPQELPVRGT